MGLSDEERIEKVMRGLLAMSRHADRLEALIEEERRETGDYSALAGDFEIQWDRRLVSDQADLCRSLVSTVRESWHRLYGQVAKPSYWLLGGDLDGPVTEKGWGNPWASGVLIQVRAARQVVQGTDSLEYLGEEPPEPDESDSPGRWERYERQRAADDARITDLSLLPEWGATVVWVYAETEKIQYALRRYDDALLAKHAALDRWISDVQGRCAVLFAGSPVFAHAHAAAEVLRIVFKQDTSQTSLWPRVGIYCPEDLRDAQDGYLRSLNYSFPQQAMDTVNGLILAKVLLLHRSFFDRVDSETYRRATAGEPAGEYDRGAVRTVDTERAVLLLKLLAIESSWQAYPRHGDLFESGRAAPLFEAWERLGLGMERIRAVYARLVEHVKIGQAHAAKKRNRERSRAGTVEALQGWGYEGGRKAKDRGEKAQEAEEGPTPPQDYATALDEALRVVNEQSQAIERLTEELNEREAPKDTGEGDAAGDWPPKEWAADLALPSKHFFTVIAGPKDPPLRCTVARGPFGGWCGYVELPELLRSVERDEYPLRQIAEAFEGLSYSPRPEVDYWSTPTWVGFERSLGFATSYAGRFLYPQMDPHERPGAPGCDIKPEYDNRIYVDRDRAEAWVRALAAHVHEWHRHACDTIRCLSAPELVGIRDAVLPEALRGVDLSSPDTGSPEGDVP